MNQRAPLSLQELAYLRQRKAAGATHRQVGIELNCAAETVRKKWQAQRRGIAPGKRGRPARGILSQYPAELIETSLAIKRAHPHWGPANVRVELSHLSHQPISELPSLSRLAVLFKQRCPEAVQPRRPREGISTPQTQLHVHQRWQVDSIEKIPLPEGQFATVLDGRDPVSAVMVLSQAYQTTLQPAKTWRKLVISEVRQALRQAFSSWGMPEEVQTDHEGVFAGSMTGDFPPPFSLWLVGLGIRHVLSRKRRPTDQAAVERSHRTQAEMSWKDTAFESLAALQAGLDQACQRYNTELPVQAAHCAGHPPLEVNPQAARTGRAYSLALEYELFDLQAVDGYLVQHGPWERSIDTNGVVWLGSQTYYLSRHHKQRRVRITYLPESRSFSFRLLNGTLVGVYPALGLGKEELTGLVAAPIRVPFQYPLPLLGGMIL